MGRERQRHGFIAGLEFLVVEVRELERLGEDDGPVGNAVRAVNEVGGVELEQPAIEARAAAIRIGELHDLHRSEEHTSELQSQSNLVCRLLLEKKKLIDIHLV